MLRQKSILDMFARSPMRPLQQHMQKVHASVARLLPFYEAMRSQDWGQANVVYQAMCEIGQEANLLKKDFYLHIPKTLFLPVSRGDLLGLLSIQDALLNLAQDIAGTMLGREMRIPDSLQAHFYCFLEKSIAASHQAMVTIGELDELLEAGFRGKEVELVETMLTTLNTIEQETDTMQVALRRDLFTIEDRLKPVDVMFLYKIIERIGGLANKAQQAGYQLQLLLAD
jgi:hypothetical protein